MNRRQACLSMLETAGAMSFRFPQASTKEQGPIQSHHRIVPLPRSREELKKRYEARDPWEVLSGDRDKPGVPFVIRGYNVENEIVPPHWHPEDEHIVIIKGTGYFGEGDFFDRSTLREVNVGDYIYVPKGMRHFAYFKDASAGQNHGIGPFRVNLVDRWLALSDPQSAPDFKFELKDRVRCKRGEGVVVYGVSSPKNRITQYWVEKDNGDPFAELEEELQRVG